MKGYKEIRKRRIKAINNVKKILEKEATKEEIKLLKSTTENVQNLLGKVCFTLAKVKESSNGDYIGFESCGGAFSKKV